MGLQHQIELPILNNPERNPIVPGRDTWSAGPASVIHVSKTQSPGTLFNAHCIGRVLT